MRYREHKEKWQDCTACPLHEHRHRICLLRGKLPADVLFLGEAPGSGENTLGKPFVGPAGDLLQHMIDVSLTEVQYTYAMTNLVACMPVDEELGGDKTRPPTAEETQACSGRLLEAIRMVNPTLIIAVGRRAEEQEHTSHWIPHPASNLQARASAHMKEIQIQRWTTKLIRLVKKGLERRKSRGKRPKQTKDDLLNPKFRWRCPKCGAIHHSSFSLNPGCRAMGCNYSGKLRKIRR